MRLHTNLLSMLLILFTVNCYSDTSAPTNKTPADKLVRLTYGEYPPYYGDNLKGKGVASMIIVEAFQRVGYQVELIHIASWARGLKMVKAGKFDGIYTAWYRKEREQWFAFSEPIVPSVLGFYSRKNDSIHFKTLSDLKAYKIGTILAYGYPKRFINAQLDTEAVNSEVQNIRKLHLKRIDLMLTDKGVGRYLYQLEYPDEINNLKWHEPPVETLDQHMMFSKKVEGYQTKLAAFNRGLGILIKQGRVKEIRGKYNL